MVSLEEIVRENARSNAEFRKRVESFTPAELGTPMPAGWTVSAVLVHLAFWDLRAITLIQKWNQEGIHESAIDTDVVNEVVRRLCLAVQPEQAVEMAVSAAEEVDRLIESLPLETAEAIQTQGKNVRLKRADHRRTHLSEIEQVLARKKGQPV